MTNTQDSENNQRYAAFDRILALIAQNTPATKTVIITNAALSSPGLALQEAERACWRLLEDGVRHLQSGGTLTAALAKTSLRSAPLAVALGIKPPQFEQVLLLADQTSPHDEAVFLCKRLIEAAQGDAIKSEQILRLRLFGGQKIEDETARVLHKQMTQTFNGLIAHYGPACDTLYKAIIELIPPAPKPQSGGRDFRI